MSPPFPLPGVRAEDRSSQRQEEHKGEQLHPGKKRNLDALFRMQKRKKKRLVERVGEEECLSFNEDEEVLNDGVVVERSDDNAKFEKEEERRRRRERSEKKSLVLKRWAKLAEDLVLLRRRRSGRRSEDNEEEKDEEKMNGTGEARFERLMRVAYAYRCSVKQKNERRRRRGRGGYGVSERGLLAQRRAMHNTVLHGIAERPIHLADSAGAEDDTEEENGRMFNAALARQFQEFMQVRGVVPTIELPEGDEAVQEKITLAKEYARREGATMRATSRMWLPRDQTAQWTGSVENVFSCVEFDRFSGGRFLACGGGGGTVSVHRTSDMNQKTSDGDGNSLLSSIYAPVYKKFVADPVDGISWVKEGVLATVSKRSDRITFHDVERGLMGTSAPTAPTGSSAAALAVTSTATTTTTTVSSRAMPTSTQSPSPRFLAYSQGLVVSPVYNVTHPSDVRDTLGITSIASCDDGNRLFAATGVGSVFTFDLRQRVDHTRPVAIFSAPTTGNLNCMNVTKDGQLVCAASSSGRVVLWDARKAVSTHATDHRGFTGIKPDKEMCSWSVSNMFSKIHGRSFASKSEVYWVDFDPEDYSRVAFHCSNGRTGVIDMKQNNHATSSLGVITHAHCPPNPWTSTAPTRITRDEAERFIGAEGAWAYLNGDSAGMATQTETEGAISSQIAKWNGRDKRTCSWSTDGQKLIVPNVNDSGILILDVMANNPKSYQWIDDGTATRESTTVKLWNENDDDAHIDEEEGANEEREDEEDEYCPGYGHKPIAPSLSDQETILSAVAVHPTCDFEYCAGGPNTLSYFRFATRSF